MSTTPRHLVTLTLAAALAASLAPGALAAVDVTDATQAVTITVPARLSISINTGTLSMDADPAEATTHSTATSAATLTVKSNATTTYLRVSATQPASGGNTIDFANYEYKVNTVTKGNAGSVTVGSGSAWAAFSATPTLSLTINGRTDNTTASYDYRVLRSWLYATGNYTSTVTYTIATI